MTLLETELTATTARAPQRRCSGLTDESEHIALRGCHVLGRDSLGVAAHVVRTANYAAERDPRGYERVMDAVERHLGALAEAGIERSPRPRLGAEGRARLASLHPVLDEWWGDGPAPEGSDFEFGYLRRWRDQVPSAAALWPLQHPGDPVLPGGRGAIPNADDWAALTHTWDAIGIRSRGAVVSALLRDRFADSGSRAWLSLGSGALSPLMDAARDLARSGSPCMLEVRDGDERALSLAETLSARADVPVFTQQQDLYDLHAIERAGEGYDLVDLVGLFEYLPDEPMFTGSARVPSASEMLRAALCATRPGGAVILGNMRTDRPHLDFVTRIIQWPYIVPRSLEELVTVIDRAGVARERVTLHLPDDDVYAVATIEA